METYIGTKIVDGQPMTLGEYNTLRGWTIPPEEDPSREGYLVEYKDGGEPNHPNYAGYISWSPKEVFENSYVKSSGLTFGLALEMARRHGKRIARPSWNGKGLWIEYWKPIHEVDLPYLILCYPVGGNTYPDGARVPWTPSQTDMLSDDWEIL